MTALTAQGPRQNGISLIEALVCLAVVAGLLGLALPALQSFMQKQRLQGIAQTLMTDLQQARNEAVRSGDAVHVSFSRNAQGSCYVMHTGSTNACSCSETGQAVCTNPALLIKTQWIPAREAVQLKSRVPALTFNSRQGGVSRAGTVELVNEKEALAIHQVVSLMGRVRSCAPQGRMGSIPACTA